MEQQVSVHPARVANDVIHDLSAGFFPGAVLAARLTAGGLDSLDPGRGAVVGRAVGPLWLVWIVTLALLVATGIARLRYWRLNVRPGFLEAKGQMAATKHLLFVFTHLIAAWALATL